jgi:malonyl-CoA/methylmalonyl-CoA synthetase
MTAQRAILRHVLAASTDAAMTFDNGQPWSWAALHDAARRWAAQLHTLGLAPGDRVVSLLKTSPALVVTLVGDLMAGVIHVPVNPAYGALELEHIVRDCDAALVLLDGHSPADPHLRALHTTGRLPAHTKLLTLDPDLSSPVPDAPPGKKPADITQRQDHDPALCIYTSGTTGPSKGATLSFHNVYTGILALTNLWRFSPQDTISLMLPLFHVHGLGIGVFGSLIQGCRLLIHERFSPDALARDLMLRGATVFLGVPTMYARLLDAMEADPSLATACRAARLFTSGSAPLSAAHFARFEALTGHRILERYGMSETLLTLSNPYEPALRTPGAVGLPIPGVEAQISDDHGLPCGPDEQGELWIRGDTVMLGYWNAPEKTAQTMTPDGWFKTGDMAKRGHDGLIRILGRVATDFIKSGGYKISAREIEEALAGLPDIAEIAIFGQPDPLWGEVVAAAIVPHTNAPPRDEAAWLAYLHNALAGNLAAYKRPRRVLLLDALPRNALGKITKRALCLPSP